MRYEYKLDEIPKSIESIAKSLVIYAKSGRQLKQILELTDTFILVYEEAIEEYKQPGIAPAKQVEEFTKHQIVSELRNILDLLNNEHHSGYFGKNGFGGRCLDYHLRQLQLELDQQK